jgi:hypothetical protein
MCKSTSSTHRRDSVAKCNFVKFGHHCKSVVEIGVDLLKVEVVGLSLLTSTARKPNGNQASNISQISRTKTEFAADFVIVGGRQEVVQARMNVEGGKMEGCRLGLLINLLRNEDKAQADFCGRFQVGGLRYNSGIVCLAITMIALAKADKLPFKHVGAHHLSYLRRQILRTISQKLWGLGSNRWLRREVRVSRHACRVNLRGMIS